VNVWKYRQGNRQTKKAIQDILNGLMEGLSIQ